MKRKIILALAAVILLVVAAGSLFVSTVSLDPFIARYVDNCATCHGEQLQGTATLGPPLIGAALKHGDSVAKISHSIATGFPERGMPAWLGPMDETEIRGLAIYIAERRADRVFTDFKISAELTIPSGSIASEVHDFRLEVVASNLHPLPFSIAPLPDGSILVTEKTQGLRIVSAAGEVSSPVQGTPDAHADGLVIYGLEYGLGWLLDVAAHPNYRENGWVYLHYTDRCKDCSALLPVSMNTLVRGRIENGRWVDEEDIWRADKRFYSSTPDIGAGGRIAFDDAGFVYLSVGVKGISNHHGIQDLSTPYGKIHRLHDDGRTPTDNPFAGEPGAYKTTWTYGHRSPQGLEYNHQTRQLWSTEMGPRGGDELNLLLPGRNYGWPLVSNGLDYDGSPVEYGKNLDIEFDLADIEQPILDLTPSPAVSSFIFYTGEQFPNWRNHAIVGSLKATELYRIELEGNQVVHFETLLRDFARIRDIESGPDGAIYLLLEHDTGGQIVRLVPTDSRQP